MCAETSDLADTRQLIDRVASRLKTATTEVVWRQWAAVGAMASHRTRARAMVDPEALVLVSLAVTENAPRLADFLNGWAAANSSLLSIQRMRNLENSYLPEIRHRLVEFARTALETGKDHRWKAFLSEDKARDRASQRITRRGVPPRKNRTRVTRPRLDEPSTLLLRLRLGVGVGVKADALSVLLGLHGDEGAWASVRAIADSLGYTDRAVRSAVEEMAAARIVEEMEIEGEPIAYRANGGSWGRLLEIKKLPRWCHWHERFTFVVAFLDWAAASRARPVSRYAFGALGLELMERHRPAFQRNRIVEWDSKASREDTPRFVEHAIDALGGWMVAQA